ncbi:hypothetical protein BOX15_Mlig017488g4 [Macrostomum lignano]|uniref:C2 domain-containing protein n=1 Tax=Macrostomum lignano TaxID=282301 RepID=A0A267DSY7_9PLAT|nr:hypothetical protein BOX15_Mlig017488g4 [Macrostomum lignano]
MADITMRLIWYRLNELYNSTSEQLAGTDLAKLDVLDLLFVGWCLFGILAVVIINFIYELVHPKQQQQKQTVGNKKQESQHVTPVLLRSKQTPPVQQNGPLSSIDELIEPNSSSAESCCWLNTLVAWLFLNRSGAPALLEAWLSALNYALSKEKQFDGRSLVFEDIIVGDTPPEIVSVRGSQGDDLHNMELLLDVRAAEVRLKVRLSRLEACEVILSEIVAQVSADLRLCPEGFKGSLRLVERPKLRSEVVLVGKPSSTGAAAAATGSYAWIAEEVTTAVSQAVTEIFLTDSERNSGSGSPHLQPPSRSSAVSGCFEFGPGGQSASAAVSRRDNASQTTSLPPLPPSTSSTVAAAAAVAAAATVTAVVAPTGDAKNGVPISDDSSVGIKETVSRRENRPNTVSREPQKQPQAVNGSGPNSTSLLIKLIKATGLKPGINAMPLNPFACVELDEPYQRHVTGSVYGSANPYWDQSYMLDLTPQSKRLSLHVFDRTNQSDLLLGSASILLDDLPSQGARVIQPLRMPRRDTAASSSVQPPTLTAEFLFVSAAAPSTMAGNSSGSNSNRFAGPRAASVSSVSAESAVTVVHVSPNSAHRSSGVGSSPESDESMVVLTSLEAAKSRTTPAAASADQLEQQQQQSGKKQKTDGTNSSLSRTVDEFMKSTDVSYQPMSSTDSAASQQQQQPSFSGVADSPPKKPPPIPLHHGQLVSESFPPDSHENQGENSMASLASTGDNQLEMDFTQSLPVLNMIPGEDDGRGTTKSKGKKASRSGSFASRFRRVFRGPDRKSTGKQQQQQQQQQPQQQRSPSIDQVFSDESYYAQQTGTSGYSIQPYSYGDGYQQQPIQANPPPTDEFGSGQRRNRSLSSSLRRLFTGGGKKKKRQRAESETRQQYSSGQQQQQAASSKSGRDGGWNSEEIL